MTRVAYFECFAGASGDMILGALIDAGWSETDFRATLEKVPLDGWSVDVGQVKKGALRATQVRIRATAPQPERTVQDIRPIIEAADLAPEVKRRAIDLFEVLAEVEGLEHNQPPEQVHFHEVGAVDSILDIVGACAGIHALGIERICVSPINVGGGFVPTRDGILPVPGPAALELLRRKGAPIYASEYGPEFLTPTGALVLATLADGFGPFPSMRVERIGYGAGQKDFTIPNALRVSIGTSYDGLAAPSFMQFLTSLARYQGATARAAGHDPDRAHRHEPGANHDHTGAGAPGDHDHDDRRHDDRRHDDRRHDDRRHDDRRHDDRRYGDDGPRGGVLEDVVVQLETNVDDMNPEWYGHLTQRLFGEGALDVTMAPLIMKKGRPGTLLSVLVEPPAVEPALAALFAETTTLGVRIQPLVRRKVPRHIERVETPYGPVRVKLALLDGRVRSAAPEYEDCHALALQAGVTLREVYDAAASAARDVKRET
ncbi:MAG: LarC family nickel insertion protein [Chloroflexi bacterium]|nr:LarC family nickel insertion protein [Chloroflexota bacterium]